MRDLKLNGRLPILLVLFALVVAGRAGASPVEVRARLEPEVIGLDEMATLTVEVQADGLGGVRFRPTFELDNLEVAAGPFRAEDIRFVNGDVSRSLRLSWDLRPLGTGPARVRSLAVTVRGNFIELAGQEIRVQEEPAGGRAAGGRSRYGDPFSRIDDLLDPSQLRRLFEREPERPRVFLRAEATPERPFVGEQVLFTIYLYTREDITAINPREVPSFQGFWVRDIPLPRSLPTELVEVDGERYGRVPLLRKALFPLRAGNHRIEPAEVELMVRVLQRGFFGPAMARPEHVELRTRPVAIEVQPLPPPPHGFDGAVGRLALEARLEPEVVRLGEAATLTVTLAGAGNVNGVPAPELPEPPGLDLLPHQQEGSDELAGTRVRSRRSWTWAVVPERAGRYRLAVPAVPYFDPQAGAYRTAAAPALELTARPRVATPAGASGLHPIRSAAFPAPADNLRRLERLAPWLFALPLGLALVVSLIRRRGAMAPSRPVAGGSGGGRRGRGPAQEVEVEIARAAAEAHPRQAAARIEAAWRGLLAARWGIDPGTPPHRWSDLLAAAGADPETARGVAGMVDDLHYLRNAPQLSATGALQAELLALSRRLLRRLG